MRTLEAMGATVVIVGAAMEPVGPVDLRDVPRLGAGATVATLQAEGIRTVMVTGDHEGVGAAIATEPGIDGVEAGVVRRLRDPHGAIAKLGDGVNDAPAFAGATVGIAMGRAGYRVAVETAGVVLMEDRLDRLVDLLQLARRASRPSVATSPAVINKWEE